MKSEKWITGTGTGMPLMYFWNRAFLFIIFAQQILNMKIKKKKLITDTVLQYKFSSDKNTYVRLVMSR